jgi:hypothetical protein
MAEEEEVNKPASETSNGEEPAALPEQAIPVQAGSGEDELPEEPTPGANASGPEQEKLEEPAAAVDEPQGDKPQDRPLVAPQAAADAPAEASVQESTPADAEPSPKVPDWESANAAILSQSRKHTRRSFAAAALSAAAAYGFYHWLPRSREDMDQPELLRRTLLANASVSRAIFNERALAPTYPLSKSENLRVNGVYGLKQALVPESWRLQLVGMRDAERHPRYSPDVTAWEYRYTEAGKEEDQGHDTKVAPVSPSANTAGKMISRPLPGAQRQRPRGVEEAGESYSTLSPGTGGLLLTLDDITTLPRHEFVTQFKCIEGWSQLVDGREPRYVYKETPDGDYYTGYDMHVMRHPQTLLVTEMMGAPLTQFHGAPLRLHMPTKYGYKQIKRIGLIYYTNVRPDDYWTKLGYDWYAGL